MKPFQIHTIDTTIPEIATLLGDVRKMLGFVPNVFAVSAESKPALQAFIELNKLFGRSSFSATEREIIQITASVENQCNYCVAGHTTFAEAQKVPTELIQAVRECRPVEDRKLNALQQFVRVLLRSKGRVDRSELDHFLANGYHPAHVLEVILGVSVKTFSNLANNAIGIPIDERFADNAWEAGHCKNTGG